MSNNSPTKKFKESIIQVALRLDFRSCTYLENEGIEVQEPVLVDKGRHSRNVEGVVKTINICTWPLWHFVNWCMLSNFFSIKFLTSR